MNVMRHRGPIRIIAGAATAAGVIATALISTAAPAAATATPYPGLSQDLGISSARAMVLAKSKLFIASGNNILVRSLSGAAITSLPNEFGVSDLLVSADGNTVYAADANSNSISVIDAASLTRTAQWPVDSCPSHLALSGSRLFVSHGCTNGSDAVGSVDATTGGAMVDSGLGNTFYYAPELAAADGAILAEVVGISPGTITSYTVSGSTLTAGSSMSGGASKLAISPDGKRLALPSGSDGQITEYDVHTFAPVASYSGGSNLDGNSNYDSVSYAPTTGRLAAGVYYGLDTVDVFSTSTHSYQLSSVSHPTYNVLHPMPGTMVFANDLAGRTESVIWGLAYDYDNSHVYLTANTASGLSIAHLTLSVTSPKAWGQPLVASVNFPGHPNTTLTLKMLPNSGSPIYVPVRTNQWGVTVAKIGANFTGRIYAYYGGDLLTRHEAPNASAIQSFTVPTRTTASMLGSYKTSGGIQYFRTAGNVHLHVVVAPPHVRNVTVVLQYYTGGRWVSHAAATFATNQWGITDLYLTGGTRGIRYRTLVSTPTTVFNTGSSAVAATFVIG